MSGEEPKSEVHKDFRVVSTAAVSGATIAMMGICIPLVAITQMVTLPLFVLGASALSVSAIWFFGSKKPQDNQSSSKIEELENTVNDLKQRLENVETISHFERAMAEKSLASLDEEKPSNTSTIIGPESTAQTQ